LFDVNYQVSNKEREEAVDCWTQCGDDVSVIESEDQYHHLVERAEFFKEMLEFTEQSYAGLESRFAEQIAASEALQARINEHENVEKESIERATSLEEENERLLLRIVELEEIAENLQVSCEHGVAVFPNLCLNFSTARRLVISLDSIREISESFFAFHKNAVLLTVVQTSRGLFMWTAESCDE
jgi:chromosome segregation ATPase